LFYIVQREKNEEIKMRSILITVLIITVCLISLVSCTGRLDTEDRAEGLDVATMITAQYRKISPQLAKEMMDSGEALIIVDVRTPFEYAQGHIPGAILIPNETISTDKNRPENLPKLDAVILVYCRSGNRSSQAARKLVSLGYVNVYDFGGIHDWPYEIVQ
jgi:rhodanese-related sulfurtransferase